jgi:hypothetical protein
MISLSLPSSFVKGWKSAILGVWAAPGARETLAKGWGRSPPPFGRVSGAPGAAQTLKMTDFRPLTNLKFPPKVQPVIEGDLLVLRTRVSSSSGHTRSLRSEGLSKYIFTPCQQNNIGGRAGVMF